jgi:polyisoprenoid-binding protein YceI
MRYPKIILAIVLNLFLVSATFGADPYVIDPVHSSIGFSVRHLVISNVKGQFTDYSGTIFFDEQDITKSSVNVTIKTASINTGSNDRDNHLRSADFFDAANHPEITFKSTRIEKKGDGYVCVGTLTMRRVSKEVAIPFTLLGQTKDPRGNTRIGLEANLVLNRQDYGISWSRTMDTGGLVAGNEVKIELNVEAVKRRAEPERKGT